MGETKYYEYVDSMGVQHKIPEGCCPICEHCTDIFFDNSYLANLIYLCFCDIHEDTTKYSSKCKDFVLDNPTRKLIEETNNRKEKL